ncbi:hypothetical protein SEA_SKOG_65 [Gordonia phage Skog]|uniref:Uncharacterized protein n=1 Tax=Gordonia phage Skog TaxID=2704033 RepID=A0A6G6XJH4_9CAUD|nr:hypothetical protein KHQ85_gp065 [Gordonia phage Skog]QIG58217.1 hypothetical protein SEA_SKOG_65 [Gordonia phage Skog]
MSYPGYEHPLDAAHELRLEMMLRVGQMSGPRPLAGSVRIPTWGISSSEQELAAIKDALRRMSDQVEDLVRKEFGMLSIAQQREHDRKLRQRQRVNAFSVRAMPEEYWKVPERPWEETPFDLDTWDVAAVQG